MEEGNFAVDTEVSLEDLVEGVIIIVLSLQKSRSVPVAQRPEF